MIMENSQLQILGKNCFYNARTHMAYSVEWCSVLDDENYRILNNYIFL